MSTADVNVIAPRVLIIPTDNPGGSVTANISGQLIMSGGRIMVWQGVNWGVLSGSYLV